MRELDNNSLKVVSLCEFVIRFIDLREGKGD